jgi:hypothetical protein
MAAQASTASPLPNVGRSTSEAVKISTLSPVAGGKSLQGGRLLPLAQPLQSFGGDNEWGGPNDLGE